MCIQYVIYYIKFDLFIEMRKEGCSRKWFCANYSWS